VCLLLPFRKELAQCADVYNSRMARNNKKFDKFARDYSSYSTAGICTAAFPRSEN
jgi:hypothetical protein